MEKIIKEVQTKEDIQSLLESFTPYLGSLSSGSVDKEALAEKYHKYAKVVVLYEETQLAGFGCFYCNDTQSRTAFLSLIAVLPCHQRKGYGNMLLSEVISIAKKEGMKQIELEVKKKNPGAIQFYQKYGFSIMEKETENSVFMWLAFQQ